MTKRPLKLGGKDRPISEIEATVLNYLTQEYLTIKQIAIRRGTSIQAVYEIKKKLEKKGLLSRSYKTLEKIQGTVKDSEIRLHGQEWNINIIWKDHNYNTKVGKTIFIDGNTIRCYTNSIEVYSGISFEGRDENAATLKSLEYWQKFFMILENDLQIILIKPRKQNITLVKAHYAEINNEMAREAEITGEKIRIYTRDDGKLWFTIDNSFNLYEAETQHRDTAKRDIGIIRKHLTDWRENNPPTLTEINNVIKSIISLIHEQAEINKETARGLNSIVELMKYNNFSIEETKIKGKPDYFG